MGAKAQDLFFLLIGELQTENKRRGSEFSPLATM